MNDEVGKVSLGLHLNSASIEKQMAATERKLTGAFSGIGEKMGKAMSAATASGSMWKIQKEIDRTTEKIGSIRSMLEEASKTPIKTVALQSLEKELAKASAQFDKFIAKKSDTQEFTDAFISFREAVESAGFSLSDYSNDDLYKAGVQKYTEEWSKLQSDISRAGEKVDQITQKIQELISSGGAYATDKTSAQMKQWTTELSQYEELLSYLNEQKQSVFDSIRERQTADAMRRLGDETERSAAQLQGMSASADRVNASLKNGIMTALKYGLGIRSLYVLFNRLRSYVSDGIKDFAQYDAKTQTTINGLQSALNSLKGSLASAFSPIVNTVGPILTRFIQWLTDATNAVGMFFAAITGKDTYKRAVAGATSTAAAISGIGSAAKEARRYLASFDQMNILSDDSSSSGGGSGGGGSSGGSGMSWEEVPVNKLSLSSLSDMISDLSHKLGELAGTAIHIGVEWLSGAWNKLKEEWNRRMAEYDGNVISVAISFAVDILSFPGKRLTWIEENIKKPFQNGMAEALGIDPEDTGWRIFTGISDAFAHANILLTPAIGQFFAGLKISQSIGALFENIDIKELGDKIRNALITAWNTLVDLLETNGKIVSFANFIHFDLDDLKLTPIEIEATASVTTVEDTIPAKKKTLPSFTANLGQWAEKFTGRWRPKILSGVTAEFTEANDALTAYQRIVPTTAKYSAVHDARTQAHKILSTTARYVDSSDALSSAKKTIGAMAKYTSIYDALSQAQKTIGTVSRYASSADGLSVLQKTIGTRANFIEKIDSIKDKVLGAFTATLSEKKDSIKDKITKNWTAEHAYQTRNWSGSTNWTTTGWTAQHEYTSRSWRSGQNWTTAGWTAQHEYTSRKWASWLNWTTTLWTAQHEYTSRKWRSGQSWTTTEWTAQHEYTSRKWASWLSWTTTGWTAVVDKLKLAVTSIIGKADGGVFSGGSWRSITAYASGGSPAFGQLFVAREAGPELVGTLGGHTAVMNNDQIVASVSAGVARAISGIKFYSRDAATPHLAFIGSSVSQSEKHLSSIDHRLEEGTAGSGRETLELLRQILQAIKETDRDVYLDGVSVKDRIVELINRHTQATGVCEIMV